MRRYYVDEFFLRYVHQLDATRPVLDLGGHKFNKRGVFDIDDYNLPVYYANLVPQKGADILADAQDIPVANNSFGTVICGELLEHVPRPDLVLEQVYRVLQSNGTLLITVPYLYQIHGDPYDYGRYTDYYWRENLTKLGFDTIHIEKQGLFWSVLIDMIRARAHNRIKTEPRFKNWVERLVRRMKHYARKQDAKPSIQEDKFFTSFTTGFGIIAKKPMS
ncbi:MAG: class I SAM-dependent methyltransferase [Chloroflexota bacterium]